MKKITNAVFLGSKSLGLSVLKCLFHATDDVKWSVIHPNDKDDERSEINEFYNFTNSKNIDTFIASSASEAKNIMTTINPDIGFVCGWYWLIGPDVLKKIKRGLWGMHNSLLPKYRGASPAVWSILNNDDFVGSTVFNISDGMDDGDILHQIKIKLGENQNISDFLSIVEKRMTQELPKKWMALINNKAKLIKQNENKATYCGQRIESDGIIDWSKEAKDIHNFVRAQTSPYPCAYTYFLDQKIKIVQTEILNGVFFGTAGQMLRKNKDTVVIACGNNTAIEIIRIKILENEPIPSAVLKSIKIRLTDSPTS